MTERDRRNLTNQAESIGNSLNALRNQANDQRAPFIAGMIRAAEESILVVYNTLKDTTVAESEL